MKNKQFYITSILMILMVSLIGVRGTSQTVTIATGTPKTFGVINPQGVSSYQWQIGADTAHLSDIVGETNATYTTTWSAAGNFGLGVFPISAGGCSGDEQKINIIVKDTSAFTIKISSLSLTAVCPKTNTNPTGGQTTATVVLAGYTLGAAESWTVKYQIGPGSEVTQNLINGALSFAIDASGATNGTKVYITGFSVGSGATLQAFSYGTTGPNETLNIGAVPTIDGISY